MNNQKTASSAAWLALVQAQQAALLETYGLALEEGRSQRGPMEGAFYVASVGFTGEEVSGFVLAVLDAGAASAAQEHLGIPVAQRRDDDFTGELCNMFAGRIKSALLARGLRVKIATPAVLSVGNLLLAPPVGEHSTCEVDRVTGGMLAFQTELHLPDHLDLSMMEASAEAGVAEGTSLFL